MHWVVQDWIEEMSAFLSLHDPNHLRTVGEEGARHTALFVPYRASPVAFTNAAQLILLTQDSLAWVLEACGRIQQLGPASPDRISCGITPRRTSRTALVTRGLRTGL